MDDLDTNEYFRIDVQEVIEKRGFGRLDFPLTGNETNTEAMQALQRGSVDKQNPKMARNCRLLLSFVWFEEEFQQYKLWWETGQYKTRADYDADMQECFEELNGRFEYYVNSEVFFGKR